MTIRRSILLAALAAVPAVIPCVTSAQSVSLSAARANADHGLLGEPLVGAAARVGFRFGNTDLLGHVGVERLTGTAMRTGNMCFVFVDPENPCPDEQVRDRARLLGVSAGFGMHLVSRETFALEMVGSFHLASISVVMRGMTSGRQISPDQMTGGADVGLDATWSPWESTPIALEAAFTVGLLHGGAMPAYDDYRPFTGQFTLTRLRLGAVWRPILP